MTQHETTTRCAAGRTGNPVERMDSRAATPASGVGEDARGGRAETLHQAIAEIDAKARAIVRAAGAEGLRDADLESAFAALAILDRVSDLRRLIGVAA